MNYLSLSLFRSPSFWTMTESQSFKGHHNQVERKTNGRANSNLSGKNTSKNYLLITHTNVIAVWLWQLNQYKELQNECINNWFNFHVRHKRRTLSLSPFLCEVTLARFVCGSHWVADLLSSLIVCHLFICFSVFLTHSLCMCLIFSLSASKMHIYACHKNAGSVVCCKMYLKCPQLTHNVERCAYNQTHTYKLYI